MTDQSLAARPASIDKRFVIQRQGRDFVLFAGLLDYAHELGLRSIRTELITATADLCVFKAVVEMGDGRVFEGHGDATPKNVGPSIAPHFLRMAETRAKARALRDATNIGMAALEELGGDDEPGPVPIEPARPTPAPANGPPPKRVVQPLTNKTRMLCLGFIDQVQAANPRIKPQGLPAEEAGEAAWKQWLETKSAAWKGSPNNPENAPKTAAS